MQPKVTESFFPFLRLTQVGGGPCFSSSDQRAEWVAGNLPPGAVSGQHGPQRTYARLFWDCLVLVRLGPGVICQRDVSSWQHEYECMNMNASRPCV